MDPTVDVEELLVSLERLDRMVLVELAKRGRGLEAPPAFRGRCLEPAYLEAVACGAWSVDDESRLALFEERLEAVALSRVRLRDRRGLRAVLRGAALAVLTQDLPVPMWEDRRAAMGQTWSSVVGPLPHPRRAPDELVATVEAVPAPATS